MIRWAIAFALLCQPVMAQDLELTPDWEYVADTVMGGVSSGQARQEVIGAHEAVRLTGDVSLDNNGGFVQIAFDLADGGIFDASGYTGIALDVLGNGETYDLRLRTDALTRPWQSFRTEFVAPDTWTTIELSFSAFEAHRTDATFDPARLRRIGILAIGREMQADIAVSGVRLTR
ncbi:CIA30 family protein [uncultured Tateyamaria sp.]|uniref:CIA30 family protein n=1 Tax=uncultured Tateyamaria sp. TaxID=455651 RepID=UPI002626BF0D|nr:CIA30 family protein [uncultured Tateyamaria sp.]